MARNNQKTRRQESSGLTKLRGWYTDFAIVFLNIFVVALVGLTLLVVVISIFESERVYSSRFIPESYELSTPEEARRIGMEFDQMGEQESYAYNPWTTFTERPFRGELLNIEETQSYPTRATITPLLSKLEAGQEDLLVWTFGGSTMMGWGVSDRNTIASHLQRELQNALPRYQIRTVNHGHAYYFSSLEVSLCIALLRKDEQPDIIIFLDGLNDVSRNGAEEPHFAPQAAAGWEAERQRRYYPNSASWFSVNANFPLYRILRRLHLMNPDWYSKGPRIQLRSDEAVHHILEVMRINRDIASSTSKTLGIQAFFFLQPIPHDRLERPVYARAYSALREATQSHPDFYDISEPLESTLKHPYVDKAHYSDRGSLVVAQRIAQTILHSSDLQQP